MVEINGNKKQAKTVRTIVINFRLNAEENKQLMLSWKKTTVNKMSAYIRHVLFGKAITVRTRNASLDEFMAEMLLLKKELNAIGVNFNQATHRLHTLDYLPQMQQWLVGWERDKEHLFGQIESINAQLGKVEEEWLQ